MGLIILHSPDQMEALGQELGQKACCGEVFAISGPLGAGKTTLIRGLARGLGFAGDVTSPTFTWIHEYVGGRLPLAHIDLFRLENEEDIYKLGLLDYLPWEGITAVEWPEKIQAFLPPGTQHWEIAIVGEGVRSVRRRQA
ncbi:tRNA (adenosine(37)-N6)-threonylcarbamoyltransferase complex ATPase subunit type 1 TsaE [Candidatus Methylacidithermus pantelleriae]|uniref:tRNA threonylcarbamoyladenosine biosynthesis protein TsaE n=1 Tax=Candidatus Methylacidithermus pantelleriae TaxID=2744239 RepID=A0A8J2FSD3_9BACT|nr:tRNA (adenosine(37)-N6)-threonylcarbamoyltransferase complex ATPase subunit type 1 TsaE [Candidatus Methylacidithermus pantelleriae]CAF0698026.1 tRNA threonylcarbamoyladenosine biosynthesis protein TsaE [Candidatus Methylacidithermus pantelleriae]